MNRTITLAIVAALSALATPVVVNATASNAPRASVPTAAVAVAQAEEPACVRRVRVVYAGHGEGQAARCTAPVQ